MSAIEARTWAVLQPLLYLRRPEHQRDNCHRPQNDRVNPQLAPATATQDDAARGIDHPGRVKAKRQRLEDPRHRIDGKDIPGQKNRRQESAERHLSGCLARRSFGRNPQADAKIRQEERDRNQRQRDENADGEPDYWEQYKDGALVAILYDDDYDKKVDRREEVPGMRPKFVAPEPETGGPATSDIDAKAPGAGSGSGSGSAAGSGSAKPPTTKPK